MLEDYNIVHFTTVSAPETKSIWKKYQTHIPLLDLTQQLLTKAGVKSKMLWKLYKFKR